MPTRTITVAHSPDSDDAFMFYALAQGKLHTGNIHFQHVLSDIETLNQQALQETYDVTAVSIHAFAYLTDRYALLSSGASMGDRYGPIVVVREPFPPGELLGRLVAIPGERTSACLALRLFQPDVRTTVVPFDQIIAHVREGKSDAGLLIHEGQLTYSDAGLHRILDLGEWWHGETGLPLPLGGNAIRRGLGGELIGTVARLLRQSIRYALEHRQEALEYAMRFARDLDAARADRFVGMYVNEWTLDYGERGRQAVRTFLHRAHERGLIAHRPEVAFVEGE
jgi:1,4-dihydroxy-6-naphthoate synthase